MRITSLAVLDCYRAPVAWEFELGSGHVAEFNIKWRVKEWLGTAVCTEYPACSGDWYFCCQYNLLLQSHPPNPLKTAQHEPRDTLNLTPASQCFVCGGPTNYITTHRSFHARLLCQVPSLRSLLKDESPWTNRLAYLMNLSLSSARPSELEHAIALLAPVTSYDQFCWRSCWWICRLWGLWLDWWCMYSQLSTIFSCAPSIQTVHEIWNMC